MGVTLANRSMLVPAVALMALCACTGQPVETRRQASGEPDAVQRRIAAEMRALGLIVTTSDGVSTGRADHAPTEWATCSPALIGRGGGGEHSSRRLVSVSSRQATVRVTTGSEGPATAVDVTAAFTASYVNPDRGGTVEQPCRSKGVLEARLLEAAG